jgi:hypothetical protein
MKNKDKIAIGMVNDGSINANLVVDLLQIRGKRTEKFDCFIQVSNIGLLTRSRNLLVKNFLEQSNAAWLLMIDSDERLELKTWDKLISAAHEKDRPVVSALVFAAFFDDDVSLRPIPTIYRDLPESGLQAIDDYPIDQIIKIDAAGTGCLLIHRSVLLELQNKATENQGKDWAWFVDGAINGRWFGEDLLFSKRLASLGIPIHAHTGAICAHNKTFWLDQRHHKIFRDAAIESKELKQEG